MAERVLTALEWLAHHPPYSLDPAQAHDYWLLPDAWPASNDI
jgi:hypothetical protein